MCNVALERRSSGAMFRPAPRGTDHSLKEYFYVLVEVEMQKYTTDPYVSLAERQPVPHDQHQVSRRCQRPQLRAVRRRQSLTSIIVVASLVVVLAAREISRRPDRDRRGQRQPDAQAIGYRVDELRFVFLDDAAR